MGHREKMENLENLSSEELAELFKDDFARLHEKDFAMECNLLDMWCLLGAVQLACRHPEFNGPTRKIAEELARTIYDGMDVSPVMREVARRGWDTQFDG